MPCCICATTGFDVLKNPLHQGWGDGLPSGRSTLLAEAQKAVVRVEVVDGQAEKSTAATSGFDQDAHDQRVQWPVIACRRGNAADVEDMFESQCMSGASGRARSSDLCGWVVERVDQPVVFEPSRVGDRFGMSRVSVRRVVRVRTLIVGAGLQLLEYRRDLRVDRSPGDASTCGDGTIRVLSSNQDGDLELGFR